MNLYFNLRRKPFESMNLKLTIKTKSLSSDYREVTVKTEERLIKSYANLRFS